MKGICYFVSYNHPSGSGNIEILMKSKIESIKDVRAIEKYIREKDNMPIVVVTNWIKLDRFDG